MPFRWCRRWRRPLAPRHLMRVAALYVYPVKACRALALDEADARCSRPRGRPPLRVRRRRRARAHAARACVACHDSPGARCRGVAPRLRRSRATGRFGFELHGKLPTSTYGERASPRAPRRAGSSSRPPTIWAAAAPRHARPAGRARLRRLAAGAGDHDTGCWPSSTSPASAWNAFGRTSCSKERESWSALEGEEVRLERDKPCGRCEVTTIDQSERRAARPGAAAHAERAIRRKLRRLLPRGARRPAAARRGAASVLGALELRAHREMVGEHRPGLAAVHLGGRHA